MGLGDLLFADLLAVREFALDAHRWADLQCVLPFTLERKGHQDGQYEIDDPDTN